MASIAGKSGSAGSGRSGRSGSGGGEVEEADAWMSPAQRRRFTTHNMRRSQQMGSGEARGDAVAWGWMWKQGKGGLMHRSNWKRRFYVLFAVPQGHALACVYFISVPWFIVCYIAVTQLVYVFVLVFVLHQVLHQG